MGMIAIMQELGKEGAENAIGPGMALALIGTLYGVALANVFILPAGENIMDNANEVKIKNKIIIEGIKLIIQKKNPILLAEELNSFLLFSERIDWKDAVQGGSSSNKKAA